MQKSYYAIIPANVRYDKNLTPNAKLLYGEITALTNEKGYCWASNDYFAQLYGTTKLSVSRWVKSLVDGGYITTKLTYKDGSKEVDKRLIWIVQATPSEEVDPIIKNDNTPYQNCIDPIIKNDNTPPIKNDKDNNTFINNTINNTSNNNNIVQQAELCIPFEEIINYLNEQAGTKFRHTTKETQKHIKARWNSGFTNIEDYKEVIDKKVDEWVNTDFEQYLRPKTLFGPNFQDYLNQKAKKKKKRVNDPNDFGAEALEQNFNNDNNWGF